MKASRKWLSCGMTDVSGPLMTWSAFAPWHLFLSMPFSPDLLNSIPMLAGLALRLSSVRLVMMVQMLSLPTPVGVWQRPNHITLAINWSFSPSNRLWSRNSMNTFTDWPLMSTQTVIPWPMSWQQPSWMLQVIYGLPAWPITTFNCIIGQGRLISMQKPCWGCLGQGACLIPWTLTSRSLQQQCKPRRRLPSKAPWAPLKCIAAICMSWTWGHSAGQLHCKGTEFCTWNNFKS